MRYVIDGYRDFEYSRVKVLNFSPNSKSFGKLSNIIYYGNGAKCGDHSFRDEDHAFCPRLFKQDWKNRYSACAHAGQPRPFPPYPNRLTVDRRILSFFFQSRFRFSPARKRTLGRKREKTSQHFPTSTTVTLLDNLPLPPLYQINNSFFRINPRTRS